MTTCAIHPDIEPEIERQEAPRVVLVDPREDRRGVMARVIQGDHLTVVGLAAGLGDATELIRAGGADTAVVEVQMPVAQGLVTIAGLRAAFPDLSIIVCSFTDDTATRAAAAAAGADGYLRKPIGVDELLGLVAPRPLAGSPA